MSQEVLQLLFCVDRALHIDNVIKPALDKGYIVITDRYMYSTVAYGSASGLSKKWLLGLNENFIKPDMTFLVDLSIEDAIKRVNKRNEKKEQFENKNFLTKVRKIYIDLAKEFHFYKLDGNLTPDLLAKSTLDIMNRELNKRN